MRLPALAGLLFLAACAGFPALPYSPPTYSAYRCDAGSFEVRLGDEAALVLWNGRKVSMQQIPAGSGARYRSDDGHALWLKGQEALFETPERSWRDCHGEQVDTPWRAAAVRGATFRATGHEPGWLVEIHPEFGGLIVLGYGTTRLFPTPKDAATFPAAFTVDGRQIAFTIHDEGCRDEMSGEYLPLTIVMTVDGTDHRGCGRFFS
ncbi:MAG: MliC family protein [Alphaproteobacteria bacterium]|nr:MliC family protein [Alphaproteobacteria bacterium]